jgi:hypothetical protein
MIQTLVTCDVFGAHLCDPKVFDDELSDRAEELYVESMKYYFDCIFGPFKGWMRQVRCPFAIVSPSFFLESLTAVFMVIHFFNNYSFLFIGLNLHLTLV